MSPVAERIKNPEPELPTETDSKLAAEASRTLSRKEPEKEFRIYLEDNSELVIPRAAARLLFHILNEMAEGNAVKLTPIHAQLTTQEAADYLNVSRPFLIKLLETGKIPYHKTGSHRRVRFEDLANYKKRFEEEREKLLNDLVQSGQEMGLGH